MASVTIVFGDELQLINEKKLSLLQSYGDLTVVQLTEEMGPEKICSLLFEDSLFGDKKILLFSDVPILKRPKEGKSLGKWQPVYEGVLNYEGDNPLVLVYHYSLDQRIKENKALLAKYPHFTYKQLTAPELEQWTKDYIKKSGFNLSSDGSHYLNELLKLWSDVPLAFLKTEFDRLFLLNPPKRELTKAFLMEHMGDFGVKNIFLFKEALLAGDKTLLMNLLPYLLSTKNREGALAYIENELRIQLCATECRLAGMSQMAFKAHMKEQGSDINPYRLDIAYKNGHKVAPRALTFLLKGLYDIMRAARKGEGDLNRFRDLCLVYCEINAGT